MNIFEACLDINLFRPLFKDPDTWRAQFVILKAIFGLPMDAVEFELYQRLTKRERPPLRQFAEVWILAGRRSAKTFIAAIILTFIAAFRDHRPYLQPGELAAHVLLAVDRTQAAVAFGYIEAFFTEIPMLAAMTVRRTSDGLELNNGAVIQVMTNNYRAVRGRTIACVVFDEVCFFYSDDSARPDVETYRAVVPSMATLPDPLLVGISSPHRKQGLAYSKYQKHFGKDDDRVLVIQGATRDLNPTIDPRIIEEAYEADPMAAASEWGGEWRSDLESFLALEILEAAVMLGRFELPYLSGNSYFAFTDPAGGAGGDSYSIAIAHNEKGTVVLDCLRERRPPFSPDEATAEFAALIRSYGLRVVHGDRYAGEWPAERFLKYGVTYTPSELPKTDLYREVIPVFNTGRLELLDNKRLISQFANLERRVARGGKESIDHPRHGNAHDDLSNVVAGVAYLCRERHATKVDLSQAVITHSPTFGAVEPVEMASIPMDSDDEY